MGQEIEPVDDPDGVREAFETLRDMVASAQDVGEVDAPPRLGGQKFRCEQKRLSIWFRDPTEADGRYWMQFSRDAGGSSVAANIKPNDPVAGRIVRRNGRRCLTHSGRFDDVGPDSAGKFRRHANNGDWIEVDGKPRFVVTPIDDIEPPKLLRHLDEFLSIGLEFKEKYSNSPHGNNTPIPVKERA